MKCPECGAWSLVKETRQSPTFGQTRRRECANEHRFTTQELVVPQEAIDYERRTHLENIRKRLESIQTRKPKRVRKSNARIY
jgi:transcriptional regulator NrdR family protein